MRFSYPVILLVFLGLYLHGCATPMVTIPFMAASAGVYAASQQPPEITEIPAAQKRALQTRDFASDDREHIFKSVMSALQDHNYVISHALMDSGLITGHKNINIGDQQEIFAATMARAFTGIMFASKKRAQIHASITVREITGEERVRVRASFELNAYSDVGNIMHTVPVYETEYYQEFFSVLSKAVFLDAIMYYAEVDDGLEEDEKVGIFAERPKPVEECPEEHIEIVELTLQEAQERLISLGYKGVGRPDGIMGPRTEGVLKKFQEERGIPPTGELDEDTLREFARAANETSDEKE